jgi:ketopantoate reductase
VILENLVAKRRTVTRVPIDKLSPGDTYDLVMVPVHREQVAEVLPTLAEAVRVPTVLFMHNHAGGTEQLIVGVGARGFY